MFTRFEQRNRICKCGHIVELDEVKCMLTDDRLKFIEHRLEEEAIPAEERLYCADPRCSRVNKRNPLVKENINCRECSKSTCSACRNRGHEGECTNDPDTWQAIGYARMNGYKRCRKCGHMIGLHHGCAHVTCRCGHQFCYFCTRDWSRCFGDNCNDRRTHLPRPAPVPGTAPEQDETQERFYEALLIQPDHQPVNTLTPEQQTLDDQLQTVRADITDTEQHIRRLESEWQRQQETVRQFREDEGFELDRMFSEQYEETDHNDPDQLVDVSTTLDEMRTTNARLWFKLVEIETRIRAARNNAA